MNFLKKIILSITAIVLSFHIGLSQIYLNENFEEAIPDDWNEYIKPETDGYKWDTLNGGGMEGRHPKLPKQGELNAIFRVVSDKQPATMMVLPAADLEYAIKPDLNFFHAQEEQAGDHDILEVYYKLGKAGEWRFLDDYKNKTPYNTWVERNIQLPDSALTDSCIIGFKGISNSGFGVCIDSVKIIERGEVTREVDTITFDQSFKQDVFSESTDNPIFKIGIEVTGNTDTLVLDSIGLKSSNTNDDDIQKDGVSLYYTDEAFFSTKNKIDSNVTITNGNIVFDSLDYSLPTGYSYFWITFDIDSDTTHQIHRNTIDAYVEKDAIQIGNSTYPSKTIHPNGDRTIIESIFYDAFNTDKGWTLTGEFERDIPQGLHGTSYGNSDPSAALTGQKIIGTDLTGINSEKGSYESDLSKDQYSATTKTINCNYYRNLKLFFSRWLNVQVIDKDTASIYYSIDNGNTWNLFWQNPSDGSLTEIDWNRVSYELPKEVEYQNEVKIKFALGGTDDTKNYTGWNIDKFALIGNYIANDLAVTDISKPVSGCGHSSEDTVIARIENTGGDTIFSPIPLECSPDGGNTTVKDSIFADLPPGKDTLYKFRKRIDLSEPGTYDKFYVTSDLANDEYHNNDTAYKVIYAPATHKLPYSYDFEDNENDFWESGGSNSSWEWGVPAGAITTIDPDENDSDNSWITNKDGNFNNNENSFVTGPCFDFREKDYPVIELRIYMMGNPEEDGAHVQYSLDGGATWGNVDSLSYQNINWDWYNNLDTITGINAPGWDENNSNEWYEVKTFLPVEVTNKNDVKFRIHFGSDGSGKSEGLAFDDISIFNAPDDVGIDTILIPKTQCAPSDEVYPKVTIKNHGLDSIDVGDTIPVGIDMQYESEPTFSVFDTCIVSSVIPPDSTYQYTFDKILNLDSIGDYSLTAYSQMEEDPDFYNHPSNDTSTKLVTIYGYPTADLGPDIRTVEPDTLTLSTPFDSDYSYSWEGGSGTSSGNEYSNLSISDKDTVIVTVENTVTGCISKDSVSILRLKPDIGVDSILSPVSDCEIGAETYVEARVKNYGTDTLFVDDSVILGATADGNSVTDTFTMSERVNPGETFTHVFNKPLDMSTLDMTYNMRAYSELIPSSYDVDGTNDTAAKSVTSYGYPDFNLNVDTTVEALSYEINAETGYEDYNWEYGGIADTTANFTVTDSLYQTTGDQWYEVTVTDSYGCSATDSAHVKLWIHDMAVKQKLTPVSDCELSDSTTVEISVENRGTDTLFTGEDLHLGYTLDGSVTYKDTLPLTKDIYPGDTLSHVFDSTADMSSFKDYSLDFFTMQPNDMRTENDTLSDTTIAWGYPNITLGPDTAVAALSYTLDPGEFDKYSWHNGYEGRYFVVKDDSTITENNYYTVTVTDNHGCSSTDSVKINLDITDLEPVALLRPEPACHMNGAVSVEMSFRNLSDFSFEAGKEIPLGYSVEGNEAKETMTLDEELPTEGTAEYTFNKKVNISGEGMHTFKFYVAYQGDLVPSNDTLTHDVEIYGDADVDLGADTLFTEEDEYMLSAGREFDSYEWQDGTTTRTYVVETSGQYSVTVIDTLGCSGSDTIQIFLDSTKTTGVNPIAAEDYKILIYPNPVRNKLTVDIDAGMPQQFRIALYNNQGQVVYSDQITTRRRKYRINMREFPESVYFIRIQTRGNVHNKQIIVQ
jgi:hypothetical protein